MRLILPDEVQLTIFYLLAIIQMSSFKLVLVDKQRTGWDLRSAFQFGFEMRECKSGFYIYMCRISRTLGEFHWGFDWSQSRFIWMLCRRDSRSYRMILIIIIKKIKKITSLKEFNWLKNLFDDTRCWLLLIFAATASPISMLTSMSLKLK